MDCKKQVKNFIVYIYASGLITDIEGTMIMDLVIV